MDLDFSGMFNDKQPKKLLYVPLSVTVLLYSAIFMFVIVVGITGFSMKGILLGIAIVVLLIANNYLMYISAYRDGFRSGYRTAEDDDSAGGFLTKDRMEENRVGR